MFIALILAFLIGVFSVLLFEAFLLFNWWTSTVEHPRKLYPERTKVINPEFIADYFKKDSATEQESCMSLNFLLAFLWREWRDSPKMKSFFLQKMNSEFSELVKGKAASKLIEQITIDELSLGTSLPVIKGATVMKIGTKDPKEVPQELDIALELEYSGGCHMAIQVDLVFSKSVYIAVKLAHLRGRARLQFSRHPLTHWSLAFYEEPELEFQAESQFEGKNLPQLTSLITSHLRKSLQKKHTLPSYNVRHSPFFEQLSPQDETQEVYVHNGLVTVGALEVTVLGCSRLPELENWAWQYCSLSVDLLPWSRLAESKRARWPTFEVPISRETNDISFGLTLSKEINEDDVGKAIVIETIVIDSPAYSAGVMAKDILVAIDGHKIESLKQAAKMIKNKIRFTATVQRPPTRLIQQLKQDIPEKEQVKTVVDYKNVALSNNSESEDEFVNIVVPLFEDADSEMAKSAVREMLSTSTELGQKAEKKQKLKQGKRAPHGAENKEFSAQAKSGIEDQVTRDQKANGLLVIDKKQESPMILKKTSDQVAQEMDKKTVPSNGTIDTPTSGIEQASAPSQTVLDGPDNVKTKLVPANAEPVWNETVKFDILKNDQYLNVCIWCKSQEKNEKDLLLGYVTIPLMDIAFQCLSLSSKRHEQCYVLATPHSDRIISNQPYLRNHPDLKERLYCGDVTLIFRHMPSLVGCDETILEKVDLLAESEHKDESQGKDTLESLEPPKHQFILTQFHFPTRCSYCNKKVWTKVAFQCRICAMICHKKCLQSCMSYTHCVHASKSTPTWFSRTEAKSGSNFKKEKEGQDSKDGQESIAEGSSESELDRNVKKREKCSDKDERKLLVTSDQTETSEDAEYGSSDQIPEAEEEDFTTKENILKANDIAKTSERVREAGRELFCNLPPEVRKNKLEDMMNRLQVEIDEENGTQTELYEQRRRAKERKQKAVIESLLEKSEERSQALAMLMLQYCAGYQSCVEAEECDRYQL